jgi:hypothetical protein
MAAGAGDVSKPRVVILGGGHENLTLRDTACKNFSSML